MNAADVAAPSSCSWGQLIDHTELPYIVTGSGSCRGQLSLLLKFSFGTSLLHVGERAVGERTPDATPLSLLAIQVIV